MSRLRDLRLSKPLVNGSSSTSVPYDLYHISIKAQGKGLEREAFANAARAVHDLNVDDRDRLLAYWAEATCGRKPSSISIAAESAVVPAKGKNPKRIQRKNSQDDEKMDVAPPQGGGGDHDSDSSVYEVDSDEEEIGGGTAVSASASAMAPVATNPPFVWPKEHNTVLPDNFLEMDKARQYRFVADLLSALITGQVVARPDQFPVLTSTDLTCKQCVQWSVSIFVLNLMVDDNSILGDEGGLHLSKLIAPSAVRVLQSCVEGAHVEATRPLLVIIRDILLATRLPLVAPAIIMLSTGPNMLNTKAKTPQSGGNNSPQQGHGLGDLVPLLDNHVVQASNQHHAVTAMINNWLVVGLEDVNYGTIASHCLSVLAVNAVAGGGGSGSGVVSDDNYIKMTATVRVMIAIAGISTKSFTQCDFFKRGKGLFEALVDKYVSSGGPARRSSGSGSSPHSSSSSGGGAGEGGVDPDTIKRGRERELRLISGVLSRLLMGSGLLDTLPTHMKTIRSGNKAEPARVKLEL